MEGNEFSTTGGVLYHHTIATCVLRSPSGKSLRSRVRTAQKPISCKRRNGSSRWSFKQCLEKNNERASGAGDSPGCTWDEFPWPLHAKQGRNKRAKAEAHVPSRPVRSSHIPSTLGRTFQFPLLSSKCFPSCFSYCVGF